MTSLGRLHTLAAAAAAIVLMTTAPRVAGAATASSAPRTAPPASARKKPPAPLTPAPGPGADAVVVRTVSAPGALSPAMQAAVRGTAALFAPFSRDVQVVHRPDGSTMVSSTGRFLNVALVRADANGEIRTMCVSSLDEALRQIASHDAPAAAAEKE